MALYLSSSSKPHPRDTYHQAEAVRRNPGLKVGGLAWTWPGWTIGSVDKKVRYLTTWATGLRDRFNVTLDFIGLQNEGEITGGPAVFSVALRESLDAAGFTATLIECCDAHDWTDLQPLMNDVNHSSAFFRAVDALAVHEPLRNTEAVPPAAVATGKRIWSSESWQSYADSDGGGCWARAVSWGYIKGNLTRHMAWNLVQSYPSVGNGLVYNGHGLMWAEVPWSGHYWVNSPIWISAHYTQATAPGWSFLPVGSGSGMLPMGGSYVSLVSPGGCPSDAPGVEEGSELTMVVQTMTFELSKCFYDTHPPFTVEPQTATFNIAADLVDRLSTRGTLTLFVRRTRLFRNNTDDPYFYIDRAQRTNRYFEALPTIPVSPSGEFSLSLGVDEVVTVSTMAMHRGDDSDENDGLPVVPNATAWPQHFSATLTGHPVDAPLVAAMPAIDQQGVWESAASRDPTLKGLTTMQQVVPTEPDEWHNGQNIKQPQTFVGPAANLSVPATLSCSVLPPAFETGWAGIGIGEQTNTGTKQRPGPEALAVWQNGTWCCLGSCGAVHTSRDVDTAGRWFVVAVTMGLNSAGQRKLTASIDGKRVAHGLVGSKPNASYANPFLTASYSTAAGNTAPPHADGQTLQSNAEFRDLRLNMSAELPRKASKPSPPTPPHPPPGPPGPPAPPRPGLGLAECNVANPPPNQLWAFSGSDGGAAGTLRPAANASACLDVTGSSASPSHPTAPTSLAKCVPGSLSQQWHYRSEDGHFASVRTLRPLHGNKVVNVSRCLDTLQGHAGVVDFWDCKGGDDNQVWRFLGQDGNTLLQAKTQGTCLVVRAP